MNYFVESESIKGESLRTLLTKCGEAPKGVMSLRHHWQEYVMEAGYWQAIWIYFIAPTLGMLAGAENPFVGSRRNSALLREAKSRQRQRLYIPAPHSAARVQPFSFPRRYENEKVEDCSSRSGYRIVRRLVRTSSRAPSHYSERPRDLSYLPRMKSMPKPGRSLAKKIW